jgi:hypothetical protein
MTRLTRVVSQMKFGLELDQSDSDEEEVPFHRLNKGKGKAQDDDEEQENFTTFPALPSDLNFDNIRRIKKDRLGRNESGK